MRPTAQSVRLKRDVEAEAVGVDWRTVEAVSRVMAAVSLCACTAVLSAALVVTVCEAWLALEAVRMRSAPVRVSVPVGVRVSVPPLSANSMVLHAEAAAVSAVCECHAVVVRVLSVALCADTMVSVCLVSAARVLWLLQPISPNRANGHIHIVINFFIGSYYLMSLYSVVASKDGHALAAKSRCPWIEALG